MLGPTVKYDKKLYKRCIKCRTWKPREDLVDADGSTIKRAFGRHDTSTDGLQSICMACKNTANVVARTRNPVARIRHHTSTRCATQLGNLAPEGFAAQLESRLGYTIRKLTKNLSLDLKEREGPKRRLVDALNEGYHIDHKRPLSSFQVVCKGADGNEYVDWDEFQRCWAISNLSAIPGAENLAKGAKQ